MKLRTLPLLVALMLGAFTSARAELVRLSFTGWEGSFLWKADSGLVSWNAALGVLTRLDVYYDTDTAIPIAPGSDTYTFSDPTRNFWKFTITGPQPGVRFTVSRPLEMMTYDKWDDDTQRLSFQHWKPDPDYGYLDFYTDFRGDIPASGLPVPPLDFDMSAVYYISGGSDWFPYPHMNEGYGYGSFAISRATVVPYVGFNPVPEPATYGAAGVAVLGMAWLRRRLRRRRQTERSTLNV